MIFLIHFSKNNDIILKTIGNSIAIFLMNFWYLSGVSGSPNLDDEPYQEPSSFFCHRAGSHFFKTVYFIFAAVGWVIMFVLKLLKGTGGFSLFVLGTLGATVLLMTVLYFCVLRKTSNSHKHFLIQIAYLMVAVIISFVGVYFFHFKTTTNKALPPWLSREQNSECAMWDFWDYHDLWHVCISFGLMMMALLISRISKPCRVCYFQCLKIDPTARYKHRDGKEGKELLEGGDKPSGTKSDPPPGISVTHVDSNLDDPCSLNLNINCMMNE